MAHNCRVPVQIEPGQVTSSDERAAQCVRLAGPTSIGTGVRESRRPRLEGGGADIAYGSPAEPLRLLWSALVRRRFMAGAGVVMGNSTEGAEGASAAIEGLSVTALLGKLGDLTGALVGFDATVLDAAEGYVDQR
jgi:hypothetical protein